MKKFFVLFIIICLTSSYSSKNITWVAIGDSITYLNDHLDETGNRVTKGYMTRVAEKLPGIKFVNQGHNGWTSGNIADEIEKLGLTKADVYSVFLGTNDWWQGRPIGSYSDYTQNTGTKTVYGAFRVIINKIRSLNQSARIILITPMQRSDFVYLANMKNNAYGSYKKKNGQSLEQFANAIASIAQKEHFALVDLYHSNMAPERLVKFKRLKDPQTGHYRNYKYPDFIDVPFNPDTDDYPYPIEAVDLTYDGLHPSDRGNEIIAEKLWKVLQLVGK